MTTCYCALYGRACTCGAFTTTPKAPPMIDHEFTREIVCPHCGYESPDSWEVGDGEDGDLGRQECGDCGKPFYAARHIRITYLTEPITEIAP